jgi:hypothetical protein
MTTVHKRPSCAMLGGMSSTTRNGHIPPRPKQPKQVRQLDVVGTAEVAELLGVERPRIGRWIKRGVMPPTAARLSATPIWHRKDIEKMREWVEANRRNLKADDPEPEPEPAPKPKRRRRTPVAS